MKTMLLAAGALLASAAPVAAQTPTQDQVIAEQLFEQGRTLVTANNWPAACPKFEESLKLDPTLGTKLNLATCYEHIGKIASAWSLYREAAELAAQEPKRRDYALAHAKALEARLPSLQIVAPANPPAGFTVKRDDVALDVSALGGGLYADPGSHTIVASAPGFRAFTTTTTLSEGKTSTVTIPPLEPEPAQPVAPAQPAPIAVVAAPAPIASEHYSTWTYAGIGTAVAGVAAVGVGLAFGAKARTAFDDEKATCPNLACASPTDLAKGNTYATDSRHDATIATVLTIAGGVAVAGGLALWLVGPREHTVETARIAPVVTTQSVGIALSGGF